MEPAGGRSSSPKPREEAGRGWEGVWVRESWKEGWFLLREEVLLLAPRSFWYSMGDCRAEDMRGGQQDRASTTPLLNQSSFDSKHLNNKVFYLFKLYC